MSDVRRLRLLAIPGDGIGPEVIAAALRVLRAAAPEIEVAEAAAGWGTFQETGVALPEATLALARQSDAVLFGAVASPSHPVEGYRSPIVALRRALDLYANIRPTFRTEVKALRAEDKGLQMGASAKGHAQPSALSPQSFVVVRENTEGLYAGRERLEDGGDTAIAERVITRRGSSRIARAAFELARRRGAERGASAKVTVVHKANVLRVTDGLFREAALAVAREFPEVEVEELLVDTAAMHLARSPGRFDVLVTTNMFGDILSDVACIHGGGLGLASSANIGDGRALFEPVHGAAPDIAGRGVANPLAAIGCVAMLLEWAADGRQDYLAAGRRVRAAADAVLREGPRTPDLGGGATTDEVTRAVIEQL
jgi:homoisocitrate dehydrogenase